jgi:hypothetical protein
MLKRKACNNMAHHTVDTEQITMYERNIHRLLAFYCTYLSEEILTIEQFRAAFSHMTTEDSGHSQLHSMCTTLVQQFLKLLSNDEAECWAISQL